MVFEGGCVSSNRRIGLGDEFIGSLICGRVFTLPGDLESASISSEPQPPSPITVSGLCARVISFHGAWEDAGAGTWRAAISAHF